MASKKRMSLRVLFFSLCVIVSTAMTVQAAEVKIGVMNVQKILAGSKIGKQVKAKMETKMKSFQQEFKSEEDALIALQQEIEKKSSVWSKDVKAEKIRAFKKKQRELKAKTDDANFEMRQMQTKELEPVVKKLDSIVKEFGTKNGYTMILDEARAGVLFLDKSIVVTDKIIEELDKALK